jgi:hypothetical protein
VFGKEGFELLPDRLDDVWWESGHGRYSFRSRSVKNSPDDGTSVPASHVDDSPIDGSSKSRDPEPGVGGRLGRGRGLWKICHPADVRRGRVGHHSRVDNREPGGRERRGCCPPTAAAGLRRAR